MQIPVLPPGVKSDCQLCYRRPRDEGGGGTCPFSPSLRRSYKGAGGPQDNCSFFSDKAYFPKNAPPQDEGLF